jgi:hypothetical protein
LFIKKWIILIGIPVTHIPLPFIFSLRYDYDTYPSIFYVETSKGCLP